MSYLTVYWETGENVREWKIVLKGTRQSPIKTPKLIRNTGNGNDDTQNNLHERYGREK